MRRAITKEIEDPLSEEILKGRFKGSSIIKVELRNNAIEFEEIPEEITTAVN
jgi:ATP-dependent Clp protease ATP-binding subunit ClpC